MEEMITAILDKIEWRVLLLLNLLTLLTFLLTTPNLPIISPNPKLTNSINIGANTFNNNNLVIITSGSKSIISFTFLFLYSKFRLWLLWVF